MRSTGTSGQVGPRTCEASFVGCGSDRYSYMRAAAWRCWHIRDHGAPRDRRALCCFGLDGLEVRHPGHSNEDAMRIGTLVDILRADPERWLRLARCVGRTSSARRDACAHVVARAAGRARRDSTCRALPSLDVLRSTGRARTMELNGRIALVTGAGRRVGRAIATALGPAWDARCRSLPRLGWRREGDRR
jgi:hypothetical protein